MKLSLTFAANGDNYEAIERCLKCLKLCRQIADLRREASCLFTLGSIYYEAGEVRQAVEAFEQCLVLRRKTRCTPSLCLGFRVSGFGFGV